MADCVFLVADGQMAQVIAGFLSRPGGFHSLGCDAFTYEIYPHPRNDSGVYNEAHVFLGEHRARCQHAVVVVDTAWTGSPGAAAITAHIESHLRNQWDDFVVVAIDPELEAWILRDNLHVSRALGWTSQAELRTWLQRKGLWTAGESKSVDPKKAIEEALKGKRIPRSGNLYRKIAAQMTTSGCTDPAFLKLVSALCIWFPPRPT